MTASMLGAVRKMSGMSEVPDPTHWLVVFKYGQPISLYGPGSEIWWGREVPVRGGRVASLNTMPQDFHFTFREIETADRFTVPSLKLSIQLELIPDSPGASKLLLRLINNHGARFFDTIEAEIRDSLESHVRTQIRAASAKRIVEVGPNKVVFPFNRFDLNRQEVVVSSIQEIEWSESKLAGEVRKAIEKEIAEQAQEKLRKEERERAAREAAHRRELEDANRTDQQSKDAVYAGKRLAIEGRLALDQQVIDAEFTKGQQLIDADYAKVQQEIDWTLALGQQAHEIEVAQRQLQANLQRARELGIDPIAISEPSVWGTVTQRQQDLFAKLLDSPHLASVLRSNSQLARAVAYRLGGNSLALPEGRRADMVLDGIDPQRVYSLPDATVFPEDEDTQFLVKAGLIVDPTVASIWRHSGGQEELVGAGHFIVPGTKKAMVMLFGAIKPIVPSTFGDVFISSFSGELQKVDVFAAQGKDLIDAIRAVVQKISPEVMTSLTRRKFKDRREVLVVLEGPGSETARVFEIMTDPANPILPVLERLIDNSAQIRFAPPAR